MSQPVRIQRQRTKGWKMPPNTVYVGRPSQWGNPYTHTDQAVAVRAFSELLDGDLSYTPGLILAKSYLPVTKERAAKLRDSLKPLRGKNLACWCKPGDPCHADVLLDLANKREG